MKTIEHPAGLPRRLGAMLYDGLLLCGLLFVAAAVVVTLNGGEAIPSGYWPFQLLLLATTYLYFGWFWTHGGQTLGMRSWRLRVCDAQLQPIGWSRALARFLAAILSWALSGLGILWSLLDGRQRCWHDLLSGSYLQVLPSNSEIQ